MQRRPATAVVDVGVCSTVEQLLETASSLGGATLHQLGGEGAGGGEGVLGNIHRMLLINVVQCITSQVSKDSTTFTMHSVM